MAKFEKDHTDKAYKNGYQNHYWCIARCKFIAKKIRQLAPGASNILDVGCGRGAEVEYLLDKGYNTYGCDLASNTPFNAQLSSRFFYQRSSLELEENFTRNIDTLMFLDVLEHIENPAQFLKDHVEKFPKVQYIFATLPARKELWSNYDEFYGHKRRYDLREAQALAKQIPISKIEKGYFFHSLYWAGIMLNFLKRDRGTDIMPPRANFTCIHKFLATCIHLENRILPESLCGSSLYIFMKLRQRPTT